MASKAGKRSEFNWLTGNSLKFDDDPEHQLRVRQLCKRLGVEFDRNTGFLIWAEIGLKLARDQPEFRLADRKRRGRPKGTLQPRSKYDAKFQVFVLEARLIARENGVPVKKIISSAAYGAQKYKETGKEPNKDQSHGLWRYLVKYKGDRKVIENLLMRCNEAIDRQERQNISALVEELFGSVSTDVAN